MKDFSNISLNEVKQGNKSFTAKRWEVKVLGGHTSNPERKVIPTRSYTTLQVGLAPVIPVPSNEIT